MGDRVLFGIGPVRELIASRPKSVVVIYTSSDAAAREIGPLAKRHGLAVEPRTRAELDLLAGPGAVHQGVVAIAGELAYADLDDLIDAWRGRSEPALFVALDGVQDPHNLGAIVRSAHIFGAHGVIIPRDRSASVTAVATKASAGATERIGIAQVTNLARALDQLKEAGVWTVALAAGEGATAIWELDATDSICLVVGSEGAGIRRLVAQRCDFRAAIPMRGAGVGSLNASVAAGVALYEVARQRRG